jgi:hypothetical protein
MESMKLLFGVLIIAVALYLCVELVPPYYTNYEFQDSLQNEALLATNASKTEDAIRETVFKQAQSMQIPVTREDIKVHRVGGQYTGSVSIEVPYTVHLDMPVYPVDLHFDPSTTNKGAF